MSKHHHCIVKHDPPNSYGDCLRACVASLLDFERIEYVPHFFHDGCDGEIGMNRLRDWLNEQGLNPFFMFFSEPEEQDVLHIMDILNPHVRYVLTGKVRSGEDHTKVYCGAKMLSDPAWYSSRFIGPGSNGFWTVLTVVPLLVVDK